MKRIKVVELIPSLKDGGADTLVRDYSLMINSNVFDVVVVTFYPSTLKDSNYRLLHAAGKDIRFVLKEEPNQTSNILKKIWNRLTINYKKHDGLRRILYDIQPDVIHSHLPVLDDLLHSRYPLNNLKLFFTCHSKVDRVFNQTDRKLEYNAASLLVCKYGMRLIALHKEMKKELDSLFNINNTIVLNNGIDISKFQNNKIDTKDIRKSLSIPVDSYVVGHIGRFFDVKNHEFLTDVFYEIKKIKKNAFLLLIAGEGQLQGQVIEKLHNLKLDDSYLILNHRSDIPELLRAMDIFIFPSKYEGFPVALVEAQATGLKCLASDVISSDCFFSHNTIPLNISLPPQRWCNAALSTSACGPEENDISKYDMRTIINQLENIYSN